MHFPTSGIVEKSTVQNSNIFSGGELQHIPLIWFNLYIFQFRNILANPPWWSFWICLPPLLNWISKYYISSPLTLSISKCIGCMFAFIKGCNNVKQITTQGVYTIASKIPYHVCTLCTHKTLTMSGRKDKCSCKSTF